MVDNYKLSLYKTTLLKLGLHLDITKFSDDITLINIDIPEEYLNYISTIKDICTELETKFKTIKN